jgi:hypothetical protein
MMNSFGSRIVLALLGLLTIALSTTSASAQWIDQLPQTSQDSILWSADVEEGDLDDWQNYDFEFPGGGVYSTGEAEGEVEAAIGTAHSGLYSVRTTIRNAYRAENGSRAVRLMRSTDRPWDDAGFYFPKEAYYSVWMYFPRTYNPNKYEPWDPGDGGWWNLFQFTTNAVDGSMHAMWSLDVDHNDQNHTMSFYLFSKQNAPALHFQTDPLPIPVGSWVHVEAYYRVSADKNGQITIWQDGQQILDVSDVQTAVEATEEHANWSLGNHTDHIVGGDVDGTATVYFDDAVVSTQRISVELSPRLQLKR